MDLKRDIGKVSYKEFLEQIYLCNVSPKASSLSLFLRFFVFFKGRIVSVCFYLRNTSSIVELFSLSSSSACLNHVVISFVLPYPYSCFEINFLMLLFSSCFCFLLEYFFIVFRFPPVNILF